jgi:hypothetical protein
VADDQWTIDEILANPAFREAPEELQDEVLSGFYPQGWADQPEHLRRNFLRSRFHPAKALVPLEKGGFHEGGMPTGGEPAGFLTRARVGFDRWKRAGQEPTRVPGRRMEELETVLGEQPAAPEGPGLASRMAGGMAARARARGSEIAGAGQAMAGRLGLGALRSLSDTEFDMPPGPAGEMDPTRVPYVAGQALQALGGAIADPIVEAIRRRQEETVVGPRPEVLEARAKADMERGYGPMTGSEVWARAQRLAEGRRGLLAPDDTRSSLEASLERVIAEGEARSVRTDPRQVVGQYRLPEEMDPTGKITESFLATGTLPAHMDPTGEVATGLMEQGYREGAELYEAAMAARGVARGKLDPLARAAPQAAMVVGTLSGMGKGLGMLGRAAGVGGLHHGALPIFSALNAASMDASPREQQSAMLHSIGIIGGLKAISKVADPVIRAYLGAGMFGAEPLAAYKQGQMSAEEAFAELLIGGYFGWKGGVNPKEQELSDLGLQRLAKGIEKLRPNKKQMDLFARYLLRPPGTEAARERFIPTEGATRELPTGTFQEVAERPMGRTDVRLEEAPARDRAAERMRGVDEAQRVREETAAREKAEAEARAAEPAEDTSELAIVGFDRIRTYQGKKPFKTKAAAERRANQERKRKGWAEEGNTAEVRETEGGWEVIARGPWHQHSTMSRAEAEREGVLRDYERGIEERPEKILEYERADLAQIRQAAESKWGKTKEGRERYEQMISHREKRIAELEREIRGEEAPAPTETVTITAQPRRHGASARDLAADYKSRGIERTMAWNEFIKDRGLKPEMDAKEFYALYDRVSASPLGRDSETVDFKPTHTYLPTGKRVMVTKDESGINRLVFEDGGSGSEPPGALDASRFRPIGEKPPEAPKPVEAPAPTKGPVLNYDAPVKITKAERLMAERILKDEGRSLDDLTLTKTAILGGKEETLGRLTAALDRMRLPGALPKTQQAVAGRLVDKLSKAGIEARTTRDIAEMDAAKAKKAPFEAREGEGQYAAAAPKVKPPAKLEEMVRELDQEPRFLEDAAHRLGGKEIDQWLIDINHPAASEPGRSWDRAKIAARELRAYREQRPKLQDTILSKPGASARLRKLKEKDEPRVEGLEAPTGRKAKGIAEAAAASPHVETRPAEKPGTVGPEAGSMTIEKMPPPGEHYVGFRGFAEEPDAPLPVGSEHYQDTLFRLAKALRQPVQQGGIPPAPRVKWLGARWKKTGALFGRNWGDVQTASHEIFHGIAEMWSKQIESMWDVTKMDAEGRKSMKDKSGPAWERVQALRRISYRKDMPSEGFAEFGRLWMTNREVLADIGKKDPEVAALTKWWETEFMPNHMTPKQQKAMLRSRQAMHDYFGGGAEKSLENMYGSRRPDPGAPFTKTGDLVREYLVDDLHGILKMMRELGLEATPDNAYVLARNLRGNAETINGMAEYGPVMWRRDASGRMTGETDYVGKSIQETLRPIARFGAKELEDFFVYLDYTRMKSLGPKFLQKSGFEPGDPSARQRFEAMGKKAEGRIKTKLGSTSRKKLYDQAAQDLDTFNKAILKYGYEAGLYTSETYDALRYRWYPIGLFRDIQGMEGVGLSGTPMSVPRTMFRAVGSSRPFEKSIDRLLTGAGRIAEAARENMVKKKLLAAIDGPGGGLFGARVPKETVWKEYPLQSILEKVREVFNKAGVDVPDDFLSATEVMPETVWLHMGYKAPRSVENMLMTTMVGGKPVYTKLFDKQVARGVMSLRRKPLDGLNWTLNLYRRFRQGTITGTPDFIVANMLRDPIMATFRTQTGMWLPPNELVKGWWSALSKDPDYIDAIANGGSGDVLRVRGHQNWEKVIINRSKKYGWVRPSVLVNPVDWWRFVQYVGRLGEEAPRMAEFKRDRAMQASSTQASFLKAEVTTDFRMRGTSIPIEEWGKAGRTVELMRLLTNTSPFFNAALAGSDNVYRALVHRESGVNAETNVARKHAAHLMKFWGMALGGLLLHIHNKDIPEYQDLPDWHLNTNLDFFVPAGDDSKRWGRAIFGDEFDDFMVTDSGDYHFKMPTVFEIGLGANILREVYETLLGSPTWQDRNHALEIAVLLRDSFGMSMPVGAELAGELMLNRNWFTKAPIAPRYTEGMDPYLRVSGRQGPTMRKFGQIQEELGIPRWAQVSPAKAEHTLRHFFNVYATYALALSDRYVHAGESPKKHIDDLPVIRRLLERKGKYSRVPGEYWDLLSTFNSAQKSINSMSYGPERSAYRKRHKEELRGAERMEFASREVREANQELRDIYAGKKGKSWTREKRRARIFALEQKMKKKMKRELDREKGRAR